MSTNTQTHYLLTKAQHIDTIRRARHRAEQAFVLASGALEDAALNFMQSIPSLTMCVVQGRTVEFFVGSESVTLNWSTVNQSVRRRVAAFEREVLRPFAAAFPRDMRAFRITRERGELKTRRKW